MSIRPKRGEADLFCRRRTGGQVCNLKKVSNAPSVGTSTTRSGSTTSQVVNTKLIMITCIKANKRFYSKLIIQNS